MGDTTTSTTSTTDGQQAAQQTGQQQSGASSDQQQTGQQQQAAGQQQSTDTGGGDGSKEAILGDLARERDKRQALEQQLQQTQTATQQQLDAIAKALGLKGDEPPDPDKLAQQLTSEQQKARDAAVQLAVYRHAKDGGADPDALLDSATFLASVKDIDPDKPDDVVAAIKAAVQRKPSLAAQRVTPGVRDAAQGANATSGGQSINDLIRAAAGH